MTLLHIKSQIQIDLLLVWNSQNSLRLFSVIKTSLTLSTSVRVNWTTATEYVTQPMDDHRVNALVHERTRSCVPDTCHLIPGEAPPRDTLLVGHKATRHLHALLYFISLWISHCNKIMCSIPCYACLTCRNRIGYFTPWYSGEGLLYHSHCFRLVFRLRNGGVLTVRVGNKRSGHYFTVHPKIIGILLVGIPLYLYY